MINNYSLLKFRKVTLFKPEPIFLEMHSVNFHNSLMAHKYNKLNDAFTDVRSFKDIVNSKHPSTYTNGVKKIIK